MTVQSTLTSANKRREARQATVLSFPAHIVAEADSTIRSHDPKRGDAARYRDLASVLREINQTVDFRQRPDLASFVNWKGNAAAPIHRWLRYREAYSPNLITKLALSDDILDPFCGCGSILIGAAERGLTSAGIDINPLAVFATRVKLTPLSRTQLGTIRAFVEGLGTRMKSHALWPMPALSIASKVFEPDILEALLRLRAMIESDFSTDKCGRDFLHLAWIAILEAVGSYFKEGNGYMENFRNIFTTTPFWGVLCFLSQSALFTEIVGDRGHKLFLIGAHDDNPAVCALAGRLDTVIAEWLSLRNEESISTADTPTLRLM